MRTHPAADLFPMLRDADLVDLARDIGEHGQHDPIELLDGAILDGRNRFAACERAGVEPRFVDAPESAHRSPVAYVVSKNIRRRHLDEGQRAMVAAKALPMLREDAKRRMVATLKRGDETPAPLDAIASSGKAANEAGRLLNVSGDSVQRAAKVIARAEPELRAAVERGDVAVSTAAAIVDAPAEKQREVAANPRTAPAAAKEAKAEKAAPKPSTDDPDKSLRRMVTVLAALARPHLLFIRAEIDRLLEAA